MTDIRNTRTVVEVLAQDPDAEARITRSAVEALAHGDPQIRLTRDVVEVLATGFEHGTAARLFETDVEVVQGETSIAWFFEVDIDVVQADPLPEQTGVWVGGWHFIPIGEHIDTSGYTDDYEDEY